jgi:hypothetical protein
MVRGIITQKEILKNPWTLYRSFGTRVFLRCLLSSISPRPQTFLQIVKMNRKWKKIRREDEPFDKG